ncbi:MAG: hypothetical protein NC411_02830 [Bacteroides sp.]|nr:hypothetical protein [Bacteroides sp.]
MTKVQRKRFAELMKNDLGNLIGGQPLSGLTVGQPLGAPAMPAPRSMEELLTRMEETQKRREEVKKAMSLRQIEKTFSREQLFRFSYVPFVIAELVWDYADTVIIQAEFLGNQLTRKLSRAIRQARAEFVRERQPYVDEDSQERQMDNGYVFEDAVKHITDQMLMNIKIDITKEYPELEENSRDLLIAVYQCHILSKALLLYMSRQKAQVEKMVGHKIGDILPKSYYRMDMLIPEFIGDKPLSPKFEELKKQYISTFATQIGLIELNDTSESEAWT